MIFNLDFFTVGIAIAGNLILGSVMLFAKKNSATSKLFFLLTVTISCWSLLNYFSYQTTNTHIALLLVRLVMFFAVPIGMLFFLFAYTFPGDNFKISKKIFITLFFYSTITMIFTLTPWVFSGVTLAPGAAPKPIIQPGIITFVIVPVLAILFGVFHLIHNAIQAKSLEKKQLRFLSLGVAIMFSTIIILNFVLPSFLNNTKFIPLGAIFTLPFVFFTAYAIIKHHLLNLKIIATEVLIFALALAMFLEVLFSNNFTTLTLRFSIFLLILGVGILLIRSVRKEVQQREQLEILDKELQEANKQLKILDQARAEFITIASHQLRTPPATIKWYLSSVLAGDYGPMGEEVKTILEKTERTNNLLISLIEDMLNVSRIERGKMEFLFSPTDLLDITKISVEQMLPIAKEKGLNLTFSAPNKKLPLITADKEKLRQVINNLIDNAIKYTRQGSVNINLEITKNNELRLTVKDSGKGVKKENLSGIFDKYTRGKESFKDSSGLGLGLYVAKIIINQHQGKIWAESEGEGKGTAFIFTLPVKSGLKATTTFDLKQN